MKSICDLWQDIYSKTNRFTTTLVGVLRNYVSIPLVDITDINSV